MGVADTPAFDAFVAEEGMAEAYYHKHTRQAREEEEEKRAVEAGSSSTGVGGDAVLSTANADGSSGHISVETVLGICKDFTYGQIV